MINQNIRIRLKSSDHNILDRSSIDILQTAKRTGAKVIGPIPMPSRIERVTVNKSPHVDKKSREQFELRTHIRMMDIIEPTPQPVDAFQDLRNGCPQEEGAARRSVAAASAEDKIPDNRQRLRELPRTLPARSNHRHLRVRRHSLPDAPRSAGSGLGKPLRQTGNDRPLGGARIFQNP